MAPGLVRRAHEQDEPLGVPAHGEEIMGQSAHSREVKVGVLAPLLAGTYMSDLLSGVATGADAEGSALVVSRPWIR